MPQGNGPFSICSICLSGANKSVNDSKRRGNSGFDIQGRFDMALVGEEGIVGYRRKMRCNKREDKLKRKAEKKKRASTFGATAKTSLAEKPNNHMWRCRAWLLLPQHPLPKTSLFSSHCNYNHKSRPVTMLLDEDPATVSVSFSRLLTPADMSPAHPPYHRQLQHPPR